MAGREVIFPSYKSHQYPDTVSRLQAVITVQGDTA